MLAGVCASLGWSLTPACPLCTHRLRTMGVTSDLVPRPLGSSQMPELPGEDRQVHEVMLCPHSFCTFVSLLQRVTASQPLRPQSPSTAMKAAPLSPKLAFRLCSWRLLPAPPQSGGFEDYLRAHQAHGSATPPSPADRNVSRPP